jgi:hypothetical protein
VTVSTFVSVPFETDAETLADDAIEYLRGVMTGWEPADGNLEVWIIEAVSRITAELTTIAGDVPPAILRTFGTKLVGLLPIAGERATLTSFWTARDTGGYTITAGTQVAYRISGDSLLTFEVVDDATILPGSPPCRVSRCRPPRLAPAGTASPPARWRSSTPSRGWSR